jgi:hypothetical protein
MPTRFIFTRLSPLGALALILIMVVMLYPVLPPEPREAHAATRLGLHVTQEELNIWRQRRNDNANGIGGTTFQSMYQNRILPDANNFRGQSHPGGDGFWAGYTGGGCVPGGQTEMPHSTGLCGAVRRHSSKASRGEDLEVAHPV